MESLRVRKPLNVFGSNFRPSSCCRQPIACPKAQLHLLLTLCCRALSINKCTQYLQELRDQGLRTERWNILTSLERDLSDLIFCHHCERLQRRDRIGPWDHNNPYVKATGVLEFVYDRSCNNEQSGGKTFKLGFQHVQFLMYCYQSASTQLDPSQLLMSQIRSVTVQSHIAKHQPPGLHLPTSMNSPHHALHFEHRDTDHRVIITGRAIADECVLKFDSHIVVPRREKFKHIREHAADVCPHIHNTHGCSPLA